MLVNHHSGFLQKKIDGRSFIISKLLKIVRSYYDILARITNEIWEIEEITRN
jgi:hypothetical protein